MKTHNDRVEQGWAHALAAPIAALEVVAKDAEQLPVAQRQLLRQALARLHKLQVEAAAGFGRAADSPERGALYDAARP